MSESTEIVEKALQDASLADVIAKEGSASLTEAMVSVEAGMKELVQHLEHQFGDDETDDVSNDESPVVAKESLQASSVQQNEENADFLEEEATEEDADEEEEAPSPQEVFSAKLFNLIASLQQNNEEKVDDWENDDDAGYLTITLSEPEFFDFEERSAVKVFMEQAKKKEAEAAAKLAAAAAAAATADAATSSEIDNLHVLPGEEPHTHTATHSTSSKSTTTAATASTTTAPFSAAAASSSSSSSSYVPVHKDPFAVFDTTAISVANRRNSITERRRSEIMGQHRFQGTDGMHCFFNLKVIFEPYKTGFEESKDLKHPPGTIIAGRYEVQDVLGSAAFSTALQCQDHAAEEDEAQFVCLKVIKNNKDFFDQSLDEIKLLQYINSRGDPDEHHVLRLIDFFYCKEHLFIVSELLKENLYEFGRFIRENNMEVYYTLPRLKRITKQILEALAFIHSLRLIHCDVKPENIVIRSFSRCEVKLIDFGSSCFTSDHLTTYIQSRSYRAPEVIIGHPYDARIDIWSVGAVVAELFTGYVLFQNDSVQTMLSRITGIMGDFPEHVVQEGRDSGKYFTSGNIIYERDEAGQYHLVFPKRTTLESRLHCPPTDSCSSDEAQFVDFIRQLLCLDPRKRPTAYEALQHPWLADADTVEFEQYIIGQPAGAAAAAATGGELDESGADFGAMALPAGMVPTPGASLYYPPPYDDEDEEDEDDEDVEYDAEEEDDDEEGDAAMYSRSVYVAEQDDDDEEDEGSDAVLLSEEQQLALIAARLAAEYHVDLQAIEDVEEEIEALAASAAGQHLREELESVAVDAGSTQQPAEEAS